MPPEPAEPAAAAREFWTGALAGFTEPTPLGIARTAAGPDPGPHQLARHALPAELVGRLDRYAGQHQLTAGTLLAGAWAVVLGGYSGMDDVVFGVDALPVRVRLDWDRPTGEWLAGLQRELARARAFGSVPLDRVRAWSELPAGRPLFESRLVLDEAEPPAAGCLLTLRADRRLAAIEARFDAGRLDPELVQRMLGHLEHALAGLAAGAAALGEVELVGPAERAELARRGGPRATFPAGPAELVPARFADWAQRAPDRTAVSCGDDRLSYRQLRVRVARLSHRLRALGVGPGVLVGICLPRGLDLVTAVLAVAGAGAGYVPVDRRDPAARVRTILDDASVAVLLTHRELAAELGHAAAPAVLLDHPDEQRLLAGLPDTLPPWDASPPDVAYVIYTSGSTGAPKGVIVEHAQLARLFDATRRWFEFGPDDVWTLFHSIAFDFSVWELWGALSHGGRLVVVPDELARDPARFRELLLAEGVTVLNQTPASFRMLMDADSMASTAQSAYRLRFVIFGGERLAVTALRPWLDRYGDQRPRLVNMYGITETTVHVSYRPIGCDDLTAGVASPIGEPIPDLAVRLVDQRGRLVPVGVPGELQVAGAGVARGYLNRPELTADRFIDTLDAAGPRRWYRTGDRARWLPAGGLEFLGRVDNQVKIRGYRIEPGEVESVLNGHPQIRESVVVARATGGPDGHRQLVAYLVLEPGVRLTWPAVRSWLAQRVPDHLVPAAAVSLDRLPLTGNGKLDRAALPAPDPGLAGTGELAAPTTEVEQILAEVYADVLGLDRVGTTDNFFALGGDSILTIQVASRARRRGVSITPAQLFTHQTVAGLATVAERHTEDPAADQEADPAAGDFPLAQVDRSQLDRLVARHGPLDDLYPLAPLQRGLLFHTLADPHSGVYFEQFSIPVDGQLDLVAFTRAWTVLHERHAVLRAAVAWQGLEVPHLVVRQRVELPLNRHDWQQLPPEQQQTELAELLATDRVRGFDLTEAPLTRLHLVQFGQQRWQVVWSHHHLLLDRWSVALLIQEIFDSYEAIRTGRYRPDLPPRPYRDYLGYLSELDLTRAPAYWRRVLAGVTAPTPLPADRPAARTGRRDADYGRVGRRLPAERSEAVRQFARAHRLTLDTVLHGAWALLLAHRSGLDDVVFAVTTSGRPAALAGVEEMVGLFINTLPARVRVSRDQPVASWLSGLQADQVRARELEHTPLDQIRGCSAVPPDQPLFESGRALVNFPWDPSRHRTGSLAVGEIQTFEQASHPLSFVVVPDPALNLQLWYDARRFTPETAENLVRAAEALVEALAADPGRPVGEVLAQTPAPASLAGAAPPDPDTPLPQVLRHRAAQHPDRIAVRAGGDRLTYRELDQRVDQVAGWLHELGAGPGSRVGVALPRSVHQVVALLGVLRAGAVHVPGGAQVALCLVPAGRDREPADGVVPFDPERLAARPAGAPAATVAPSDLAVVVWGSGTEPAVELTHGELARRAYARRAEITGSDLVGQLAESGSEVAAWEIWAALTNGAGLAVCPAPEPALTVLTLTSRELSTLLDQQPPALAGARLLLLRGELTVPYARRLRATLPSLTLLPAADIEVGRVAHRLQDLPTVRAAAIRSTPDGRSLVAYLVPETRVLDGGGELVDRLSARHLAQRQAQPGEPTADWQAGALDRLRALGPARVLEVGGGTGSPLAGLLPGCERCAATDELDGFAPGSFDLVVLSSVVQDFPGASYLERVLDAAVRVADRPGAVVVGGVPDPWLREAFHVARELHRAADLLPTDELYARVTRSLADERELLVDPAYFTGFGAGRPEVGAVAVLPSRGGGGGAATRFCYDAVLRLGPPPPPGPASEPRWYDWRRDVLSPSEIGWLLDRADGDSLGVTGVPDARVAADLAAARLLAGADAPVTAGELRLAAGKAASGVDPEELYQLGQQRGWSVTVGWAGGAGSVDVLFQRGTPGPDLAILPAVGRREGPLTNTPLRGALVEDLPRQVREALAESMPEYADLIRLRVRDELPVGPEPEETEDTVDPAAPVVPPRTADELRLARIWERVLPATPVDVRSSFFDLGGDSMLAIRLIDEATRVLGRDFPLAALLRQPTIEGMAAALAAEPGPWSPLVELSPGTGNPFFCVHPAGGNVLCYAELGRLVRPYPFYALQGRGVEGDDPPDEDIPAMAARYLPDVRARQTTGPYLLGGWSMGGLVAYEMAQQLVAAGEQVGLLVLVDTPTPELIGELPDQAAALARLLDGVVPVDLDRLRAMPARERLRYVLAEAERRQVVPPGMDRDRAEHLFEVFAAHIEAVRRYQPRPFGGPVRLLRAVHSEVTAPDYGWGELLTGRWETIDVPGNHETVVWPPNVQRLAEVLLAQLPAATGPD